MMRRLFPLKALAILVSVLTFAFAGVGEAEVHASHQFLHGC